MPIICTSNRLHRSPICSAFCLAYIHSGLLSAIWPHCYCSCHSIIGAIIRIRVRYSKWAILFRLLSSSQRCSCFPLRLRSSYLFSLQRVVIQCPNCLGTCTDPQNSYIRSDPLTIHLRCGSVFVWLFLSLMSHFRFALHLHDPYSL